MGEIELIVKKNPETSIKITTDFVTSHGLWINNCF
jgi:hypothetical protein